MCAIFLAIMTALILILTKNYWLDEQTSTLEVLRVSCCQAASAATSSLLTTSADGMVLA
jgi:hypothetical protein